MYFNVTTAYLKGELVPALHTRWDRGLAKNMHCSCIDRAVARADLILLKIVAKLGHGPNFLMDGPNLGPNCLMDGPNFGPIF